MSTVKIDRNNVGRIAERIVANELEARGFRVNDLNNNGTAANADLLAVRPERTLQVQVKGAVNETPNWWIQYGYCTDSIITNRDETMFNRRASFYKADLVVLVAVLTPREYCCVVLPVEEAERAAQLNLDRDYRRPRRDGQPKKPNKVWASIDPCPRARKADELLDKERAILAAYRDEWDTCFYEDYSACDAVLRQKRVIP